MNTTARHKNTVSTTKSEKLAALGRRGILVLAAAITIAHSSQASHAAKIAPLTSGAWTGGAYSSNQTGEFSHCAVSSRYKSGVSLLFSVTKQGNWTMGVSKPSWDFNPGNSYGIRFQVDRGQILNGTAKARNNNLVQIGLPTNSKLFRHFRYGKQLKIETANKLFRFNLTGTETMLKKLVRCVAYYRKADNFGSSSYGNSSDSSNPFRSASATVYEK